MFHKRQRRRQHRSQVDHPGHALGQKHFPSNHESFPEASTLLPYPIDSLPSPDVEDDAIMAWDGMGEMFLPLIGVT